MKKKMKKFLYIYINILKEIKIELTYLLNVYPNVFTFANKRLITIIIRNNF